MAGSLRQGIVDKACTILFPPVAYAQRPAPRPANGFHRPEAIPTTDRRMSALPGLALSLAKPLTSHRGR